MNVRTITVLVSALGAVLAGLLIPLESWPASAKSIMTILAILAAGVLVRLNRGLPTIDWSKVDPAARAELVKKMRNLSVEYGLTLAVIGVILIWLLASEMIDARRVAWVGFYNSPPLIRAIASGIAGGSLIFAFARMVYVVWRDIDIVELQSDIITSAAASEIKSSQVAKADAIRAAGAQDPRKRE